MPRLFDFMPRFFDLPRKHRTGGLAQRDNAFGACVDASNRCNDVMRVIELGGPIDAPDLMPAGGCEGIKWWNPLAQRLELHAADVLRPGVGHHPEIQP